MSLKEQVSSQLNQLSEAELAKVSQYIELKGQLPPRRIKNNAYLNVRKALEDVSGSIIVEREDRL